MKDIDFNIEQFVKEVKELLKRQSDYFRAPRDAPNKMHLLIYSKEQERIVRKMTDDYLNKQLETINPTFNF